MTRTRSAFIVLIASLLALNARATPSYDCAKAMSAAEKEVCRVPDLQWFDRQLAHLFKLAKDQPGANRDALTVQQRQFIVRREACRADFDCLQDAYKARLAELAGQVNVFEAYAEYSPKSFGGSMWIVRDGYHAGVKILTVGDGGHSCAFEADNADTTGKGVVKWRGTAGDACRIDIIPDAEDLRVETHNCQAYCGVRAVMDGVYGRAR
jgi:hypothetical protein